MSFSDFFENDNEIEDDNFKSKITKLKDNNTLFLFDTSSLSQMNVYPADIIQFQKYWELLDKLIENDLFYIPTEVKKEMKEAPPDIRKWFEALPDKIVVDTENIFHYMAIIEKKYPKISYKNLKNTKKYHADPHLIAMAVDIKENMNLTPIIVTEENDKSGKIPFIAKEYNISCVNILDLLVNIGILNRRKPIK
ncbi:MAG: DUF4411 family protein [Candidatus Heimdallarchaeota archaeon]|nr:DUF4411 family protein [Candidatus Heimdallarchaeota archaeon]